MDNVSYHKSLPPDVLAYKKLKKEDLVKLANEKFDLGIVYSKSGKPTVTAIREVVDKLMTNLTETHCERIVREFAAETGVRHEILFTPPYHSDLQPIEMLWALVKGEVGRAYDNQTTYALVGERLRHSLLKVETTTEGRDLVGRIIASTDRLTRKFMPDLEEEETQRAAGGHEEREVFPAFVVAATEAAAAEEALRTTAQEGDSKDRPDAQRT